jgi:hypothetical protein
MSTTLSNAEIELSKQTGDFWSSSATATASNTQLTDSALVEKTIDWLTDETYLQMTTLNTAVSSAERLISTINVTSGFVTWNRTLTGNTINTDTYRIHRLFSASEKSRALINACKMMFPYAHERIRNESKTTGDWLKDGGLEVWTSATAPTYWTVNATTANQCSNAGYVTRGIYSCKLTTAIGDISQGLALNPDLLELKGKTITFKGKLNCSATNCARLQITDGITTTNSAYHAGDSSFGDDFIDIEQSIAENATAVTFKVLHANASATTYVDDLRVIGPRRDKVYIGDLGLAQNQPHVVSYSSDGNIYSEPWITLHNYNVDADGGYLNIEGMPADYRLRIEGIGYLDFKLSGASSTNWAAVVNVDDPQLQILVAQAAIYLCNQKALPSEVSGVSDQWYKARANWENELQKRKAQFGMTAPPATTHWG